MEEKKARSHLGPNVKSALLLTLILAGAKIATFLPLLILSHTTPADFLKELGTKWDSNFYNTIAQLGYKAASKLGSDNAFAFSPVLPSMIATIEPLTGSYWFAGLIIVNTLSFIFPLIILKISDFKTALILELFPVYLVFSTLNYADVITLCFLASSLFFLLHKKKCFFAGLSLAFAVLATYDVILMVPIFVAKVIFDNWRGPLQQNTAVVSRLKNLASLLLPMVLMSLAIAAFFLTETGSLWTFFSVEKNAGWGVNLVTPVQQFQFLLTGWFTGFKWTVMGTLLPPIYWALRNMAFEAFYITGVVLLFLKRNQVPDRLFLSGMAVSIIAPLFFLDGVAAASIPRLLLPAFTVFFGYSVGLLKSERSITIYSILCLVIAPLIAIVQIDALFS